MAYLTSFAAFWNVVSLVALSVALPLVARRRQPASYIFTGWEDGREATGVRNGFYTALLGLLISQYLFLGFDASAHVCEETRHADINAPRGMVAAAGTTAVCGYAYLLSLNASVPHPRALLDPNSVTRGDHAVAQLLWDVHKAAFGDGRGALPMLSIPLVAALMCVYQSVANNARMLYAFA
ncbi:Amino-acid permease BAT1, partial [Tetrabaena socialis]